MRVLVRGYIDLTDSGKDTLDLIEALDFYGAEVYAQLDRVEFPVPPTVQSAIDREVNPPYDLDILISPWALTAAPSSSSSLYLAWVAPPYGTSSWYSSEVLPAYSVILGYDQRIISQFGNARALRPGINLSSFSNSRDRYWQSPWFAFAFVGPISDATGAFSVLQAFKELKQDEPEFAQKAELNIYTHDLQAETIQRLSDYAPGIKIVQGDYTPESLKRFYSRQHVLLQPSYASSRTALEFMSSGGVVVTAQTNQNSSWLDHSYAYVVYESNVESVKQQMLRAFWDPAAAKRKASTAQNVTRQMFSWPVVLDRLFLTVADVVPVMGQHLKVLAALCEPKEDQRSG